MLKKIQIKKDNLIFSRFEMKYILNQKISLSIQNEIKNFMIYDGHINKNSLEKKYYVRSIYFDNLFIVFLKISEFFKSSFPIFSH